MNYKYVLVCHELMYNPKLSKPNIYDMERDLLQVQKSESLAYVLLIKYA